jgi:hypothetical protein
MMLRTLRPTLRRPGLPQYPKYRRPLWLWLLLSLEQLGFTDLRFVLVEWNAADLSWLGLGMGLGNFSIKFGPLILISICCVGFCSPQFISSDRLLVASLVYCSKSTISVRAFVFLFISLDLVLDDVVHVVVIFFGRMTASSDKQHRFKGKVMYLLYVC